MWSRAAVLMIEPPSVPQFVNLALQLRSGRIARLHCRAHRHALCECANVRMQSTVGVKNTSGVRRSFLILCLICSKKLSLTIDPEKVSCVWCKMHVFAIGW